MDDKILSKDEKEVLQIIKNSFSNISDKDALGLLNIMKHLSDVGDVTKLTSE